MLGGKPFYTILVTLLCYRHLQEAYVNLTLSGWSISDKRYQWRCEHDSCGVEMDWSSFLEYVEMPSLPPSLRPVCCILLLDEYNPKSLAQIYSTLRSIALTTAS